MLKTARDFKRYKIVRKASRRLPAEVYLDAIDNWYFAVHTDRLSPPKKSRCIKYSFLSHFYYISSLLDSSSLEDLQTRLIEMFFEFFRPRTKLGNKTSHNSWSTFQLRKRTIWILKLFSAVAISLFCSKKKLPFF